MNTVIQANQGFTALQQNGRTVFSYEQEKYSTKTLFAFVLVCALIAPLPMALFNPSSALFGLFLWVFFTIALFKLLKFLVNKRRTPQSFAVDRQGFHVDGNTYVREHVTAVFIKAWKSEESNSVSMQSGMFIPVSGRASSMLAASSLNAVHAVGQLGSQVARASRMKMIAINYRVYIRYGNKPVMLAKGMTSDTAELMLNKIIEVSDAYKEK